jgi:peptidoglycan/LPS O-acetylase OafA/YrhL
MINSLTALRGYAAFAVLIFHLLGVTPLLGGRIPPAGYDAGLGLHTYNWMISRLAQNGWYGADIFIILSGFIITHRYRRNVGSTKKAVSFMLTRLGRIYPSYAASLVALWAMYQFGILPEAMADYDMLALHATLTFAWFPPSISIESWNPPGWSVSCEFFNYLLFPFIALVMTRSIKPMAGNYVSMMLPLALLLSLIGFQVVGPLALTRGFANFMLGYCCAMLFPMCKLGRVWGWLVLLSIPVLLFSPIWLGYMNPILLSLSASAIILGLALHSQQPRKRGVIDYIFLNAPSQFIGRISYSLYVWQFPVLLLAGYIKKNYFPDSDAVLMAYPSAVAGLVVIIVGSIVLVSWLVYRYLEKPASDGVKRWVQMRDVGSLAAH